jgi:hypothetical protein
MMIATTKMKPHADSDSPCMWSGFGMGGKLAITASSLLVDTGSSGLASVYCDIEIPNRKSCIKEEDGMSGEVQVQVH